MLVLLRKKVIHCYNEIDEENNWNQIIVETLTNFRTHSDQNLLTTEYLLNTFSTILLSFCIYSLLEFYTL